MRRSRVCFAFCCALLLTLLSNPAEAGNGYPTPTDEVTGPHVTSWILVRLQTPLEMKADDGGYLLVTGVAGLDARIVEKGVHRIDDALTMTMKSPRNPEALARYGLDRTYRFHVPPGSDIPALVAAFSRSRGVAFAEPDYIGFAGATVPDDTRFTEQWGLDQTSDADIDAPEAWDLATGSFLIGILDGGVDATHPDLDETLVPGWDFVNDDPDTQPDPTHSHGTHVSSIASAETNNTEGMAGVCWDCPIMPLMIVDTDGTYTNSRLADAVAWATDQGIRLFNLSAGGSSYDQIALDAVAYAYDAGAVFVAATGNDAAVVVDFPARFLETIAVGLTKPDDTLGDMSNYGPQVDVVAPGNTILGAVNGGGYETWNGTSMATPHVTGLLGMIMSVYPSVGREEARFLVRCGCEDQVGDPLEDTPGFDFYHGWGRLNMHRALQSTQAATTLYLEGKTSTLLSYGTPDPLIESWDFVRGDLSALREDRYGVDLGSVVCLENDSADADTEGHEDTGVPAPGEAFFYVARPNAAPGAGSYGGSTLNRDRVVFPVRTAPAWIVEADQAGALLGSSVGRAGDVNNDGFDDVIIGAMSWDGAITNSGAARVYHGSASGLGATADWTVEGPEDADFGWSLAGAGDVNNDGYDDVIVGDQGADAGLGRAYLYLGSGAGLATSHAWLGKGRQTDCRFGFRVRSAGDVNGDDHDDILVSAYLYDGVGADDGAVYVHLGTPTGVEQLAAWTMLPGQAGARFGVGAGTAGDVNGDGYDDVIVGAPLYDNGETNEGRIFVYHGSAAGLSLAPNWTWETDSADSRLGYSVGTAGDVNNDGYDDVVAGAWFYSGDEPQEGKVYLFLGSPTGLASSPGWSFELDQGDAQLGISTETAGDVNNDGYDDVIVGSNQYDGVRSRDGGAWLFLGSNAGLSATPVWFETGKVPDAEFGWRAMTAGDVNGDLFDDLIIGAWQHDNGEDREGRAYVYHGPLNMTTTDCP